MSRVVKFTLFQVITWFLVGLGMFMIVTRPGVIENWGDNKYKSIALAILFLLGYGTDLVIRMLEKSKKFGFIRDERSEYNQLKAMSIGFIIVLIFIFVFAITLYTRFENKGFMPIGYVWILAYSTIIAANLGVGIPTLIIYRKQEKN